MIHFLFLATVAAASPLPSGIYCSGYDYPEIETPQNFVDAKEASRISVKNRAGVKDIEAFREVINKSIGMGMLEVYVRVPYKMPCPKVVQDHFEKLGYTMESTNDRCIRENKRCSDWGYCTVRWGKK